MASIQSELARCNELIQSENELCHEMQQCAVENNCAEVVLNRMKGSLAASGDLIDSYNQFMQQNLKSIASINKNFEGLWDGFESTWRSWSACDVAIWLQLKAGEQLRDQVDWAAVSEQLQEQEIIGDRLHEVNALTFKFIGIKHAKIVSLLVSALETLKKRDAAEDKEPESKPDIPEKFMCPITHKAMRDPVLAFDGHSYERAAIEKYLKEHGKSPITGDEAVTHMVFPNNVLKSMIDDFIEEEEPKEGDGETAMI